jgi:hypothetical protein
MAIARRDAVHRVQPSLFDQPQAPAPTQSSPTKSAASEQDAQLQRVKGSIADTILEFFRLRRIGDRFFAADLHRFVGTHAQVAPASADRVMRDLRKSGQVNYCVVSRSRSEYRVEAAESKG